MTLKDNNEIKSRTDFYRYAEITDILVRIYNNMEDEKTETKLTVKQYIKERIDIMNKSEYAECNYKYKGINC